MSNGQPIVCEARTCDAAPKVYAHPYGRLLFPLKGRFTSVFLRVREAKRLLEETDRSLARIARVVGYRCQGSFTKAFERSKKLTPSACRFHSRE